VVWIWKISLPSEVVEMVLEEFKEEMTKIKTDKGLKLQSNIIAYTYIQVFQK
jgi:hypothetical protein